MKIFEFIKKIFSEDKEIKDLQESAEKDLKKKIKLNELKELCNKEKKRINEENNKIKENFSDELSIFSKDLESMKEKLKTIGVSEKKENEKIKLVVEENLNFYILGLNRFISDIQKVNSGMYLRSYLERVKNLIDSFEKNSFKNYEKATILIGEELAQIKNSIRQFYKKINSLLSGNESNFDKLSKIEAINNLIIEIENFENKNLALTAKSLEEKNNEAVEEKETIENNYRAFKNSEEFKKYLIEREELKSEINEFNKEIMKLKEKVNLRFLLKYFHKDHKKTEFLKNYQENFIKALDEDVNLEIANIVKEVFYIDIKDESRKFIIWNREIKEKNKEHKIERQIKLFEEGIKNLELQIKSNKDQLDYEKSKLNKLEEKRSDILNNINFNVKFVFGEIEIS